MTTLFVKSRSFISRNKLTIGVSTTAIATCSITIYLGYISSNGAMRESPRKASTYLDSSHVKLVSQKNYDDYVRDGFVVIDNILLPEELELARNEVNKMMNSNQHFIINNHDNLLVRSDLVVWINESIGNGQKDILSSGLLHALRCIRSVPSELQDFDMSPTKNNISLGVPFSNQLACYDGAKSHYMPHRDCPEATNHPFAWFLQADMRSREVTVILYLNDDDWNSNEGGLEQSGHLRAYLHTDSDDVTGTSATSIVSIAPKGGRMVIMNSKKVLHEVCPTAQRRIALTCWAGGRHSHSEWLRPACIPVDEINWKYYRDLWFG